MSLSWDPIKFDLKAIREFRQTSNDSAIQFPAVVEQCYYWLLLLLVKQIYCSRIMVSSIFLMGSALHTILVLLSVVLNVASRHIRITILN